MTGQPFEATAKVEVLDGLVCITITAPGAPETVMRLPRSLAVKMANQITRAAAKAPASYPTGTNGDEE